MANREILRVVMRAATRSHGVVTREKAHRCGATDRMLRGWVDEGTLLREGRHVFTIAGAPRTWEQRLLATCRVAGATALVSHGTAAAVHRFDGFSARPGRPSHITVATSSRFARDGWRVHRSGSLLAIDRCHVGVIPATSPLRTIIDLAAVAPIEQVEEALDGAERDGKVNRHALEERVAQLRTSGRNGIAVIGALLDRRATIAALPASVLERRFRRILERHGLPQPVAQYRVTRTDGRTAYLDFALVEQRVAVELHGNGAHATPRQRAADYERANTLPDWQFIAFTYEDVMQREAYVASCVSEFGEGAQDRGVVVAEDQRRHG
jgi:hypothetical protein